MSVSLVEVIVAASRRLAPLSGECAGHAVLAAADQLLSTPRLVGAAEVLIEESGAVRLAGGAASDERGCDQGLRGLLDGLLAVAHSGGAGLVRVGQRTGTGDLGQLVKELEVALIPANRAAARRSLARLHRETERARDAGRLEPASDVLPGRALLPERARPPSEVEIDVLPARAMHVDAAPVPPQAHAVTHGSGTELSASELDLLAITEVRFATGPRAARVQVPAPEAPNVEADFAIEVEVEVEVEMSARTAEVAVQTQPLPKVAPRRGVHETAPLPPVSTEPRIRTEHETPLEPVLGRRYGSVPAPRHEPADIHKTPYLGTLVATLPYYDSEPREQSRERWQGETSPLPEVAAAAPNAEASADWEEDDATTDPAPVVAWSGSDDVVEAVADAALEFADADADAVAVDALELADAEVEAVADAAVEFADAVAVDALELADAEVEAVADAAPELADADAEAFADAALELADDVVEPAADAALELADDVVEPAADAALELAETGAVADDMMELTEDDVMELTEDDVMELAEDDVTELVETVPFAHCAALSVQPRVIEPLDPKPPRVPRTSDVEALLERFRIAEPEPEPQLMRGLKQLAGITVTPPPVLVRAETRATPEPATELPQRELGAPIRPVPTVRIVGS